MKLYEYWEPEEIAGVIRDVDPGLLSGALPAAFAREMADWQYGESHTPEDPAEAVAFVRRDDLPPVLKPGFGDHEAAVVMGWGTRHGEKAHAVTLHDSLELAEADYKIRTEAR